jgi:hypothetical protein
MFHNSSKSFRLKLLFHKACVNDTNKRNKRKMSGNMFESFYLSFRNLRFYVFKNMLTESQMELTFLTDVSINSYISRSEKVALTHDYSTVPDRMKLEQKTII